jgi:hypothetical protein
MPSSLIRGESKKSPSTTYGVDSILSDIKKATARSNILANRLREIDSCTHGLTHVVSIKRVALSSQKRSILCLNGMENPKSVMSIWTDSPRKTSVTTLYQTTIISTPAWRSHLVAPNLLNTDGSHVAGLFKSSLLHLSSSSMAPSGDI